MSRLANWLKGDGTAALHARPVQRMCVGGAAAPLSNTEGLSVEFLS